MMKVEPTSKWSVRALMAFGKVYARTFHDLRVLSPCRLPARGPAILVCNHTSGLDPVLIQSTCSRLITWMMAKEFYDIRWFQWGYRLIEAIPVARSGRDVSATRAALRALKDGRVLGIFPEGRIEPTRDLMPFQTGAALVAARSGAAVYPAFIDGTQRRASDMVAALGTGHAATLRFGEPLLWSDNNEKPDLDARTADIQAAVERLKGRSASMW